MEGEPEAVEHVNNVRSYRKELSEPLHNPEATQEEKSQAIDDLRAFRELNHEDPDYRQALRIISGLRTARAGEKPIEEVKKTRESVEFPTEPDERYAAILSSLANRAGKQITFLSIPNIPNTIITPWELHKEFLENSGHVWKTNERLQMGYTQNSLISIGMVAEEVGFKNGIQESTVGFTQTEAGKKYGDPIARFLLKYASEHDISLEQVFGPTHSRTDSRAPYNRARVLEFLYNNKTENKIRIADIKKGLGLPGDSYMVTHALRPLEESGFAIFESVNIEKTANQFSYSVNPDFQGEGKTTQRYNLGSVLEAIATLQRQGFTKFEVDTVVDKIKDLNPNVQIARNTIQYKLADIAKSGYLVRNKFKGSEDLSSVSILSEGEEFVNDVLTPLRIALTDTPEGEQLRHGWGTIPWQEYAPKALQLHKDNSNHANPTGKDAQVSRIRDIVSENPGIRTGEIMEILKQAGVPYKSINSAARSLLEKGEITNTHEGRAARWYPVEKGSAEQATSSQSP